MPQKQFRNVEKGTPFRKSFDGGEPKNKKHPAVKDINWRALNESECRRLYNAVAKQQMLAIIIAGRRKSMDKVSFKAWSDSLKEVAQ